MSTSHRSLAFATFLGVAALLPAFAARGAEPPVYPPAGCTVAGDASGAKQAYVAGKKAYDAGDYEVALEQFLSSYKKDCTRHGLLPVIATVYEKQANYKDAVRALKLYLEREPELKLEDRTLNETKIRNLEKRIAEMAPPPPTSTVTAPPPPVPVREHTAAPWVVVGVGVVVLGTGIGLSYVQLPQGCKVLTETDPEVVNKENNPRTQESYQEGDGKCNAPPNEDPTVSSEREALAGRNRGLQVAGVVGAVVGGVAVAGGLLWHFLEPTGPVTKKARLQPVLSPGYAGISVGGTF